MQVEIAGTLFRRRTASTLAILILCGTSHAQLLPPGVINSPPTVIGDDQLMWSDTTLNVFEGGVVGRRFDAGHYVGQSSNVFVNVYGGDIGWGFSVNYNTTARIMGGNFGSLGITGTAYISGGVVGDYSIATSGSTVDISGGTIGDEFRIYGSGRHFDFLPETRVNISGGAIGKAFQISGYSTLTMSGGSFGKYRSFGSNSTINLIGTEFFLDGIAVDLVPGSRTQIDEREAILSGMLADGSPIELHLSTTGLEQDYFAADATLTLTLVPEPISIVILAMIMASCLGKVRRT